MSDLDVMALPEAEIRACYPAAEALLTGFDHAPRLTRPREGPATGARALPGHRAFRSTTPGLTATRPARGASVHLLERIRAGEADALISPAQAGLARALRRALAVALALGEVFAAGSGLAELKRTNREGRVPGARQAEFARLLEAEALVVLHVFANATAFLLAPQLEGAVAEGPEPEEILTENAPLALQGTLWELDTVLEAAGAAQVAAVAGHAERLMAAVALRIGTAPVAGFAGRAWRIGDDDLVIRGFAPAVRARSTRVEMEFAAPREVVGNAIAKHQAMKLARMMMAYDPLTRMNPFAEMGGFAFTFLGDGRPGTGKTTLIRMMAGLLNDYCAVAGYAFCYRNLSVGALDSYQGKSGQNARDFIAAVSDPAGIGFGTIDDVDQVAGRRGDRQASAGQQEITAVLMEAFAGAQTVVRGNCSFGLFSNFPERVDDALRQRAGARFAIDGPQSREDYIDLLALLMGEGHDIPLGQHDFLAAQEIRRAVAHSYAGHDRPAEPALAAVLAEVEGRLGPLDTLAKLGSYLKAIQEADPRFTGRAVKNITDAVKARSLDVELPEEWMQDPGLFLHRDYATKRAMIGELRKPVTARMLMQEINRYGDSELRYAGAAEEAAVTDRVREMERAEAAQRRFRAGRG
ncbi:ATP-binding protein [Pseudooceanicola sp. CBS1P-1]|uniref:AAA family ATPase n=1 Tax=Pseudooceanicola albus TaxID=2692189 RepID=A0A6L7G6L6_9RHOB|nr:MULTISPECIES: ATP-binding protein [Pseudooceanicola]MBT9384190.1 ATP-binding protein [Pseudooceanicola endophyticus]MXN19711.1 AAA family ATPase [Pseudooceanicola albus]